MDKCIEMSELEPHLESLFQFHIAINELLRLSVNLTPLLIIDRLNTQDKSFLF